jgi:hypothetical protein
MGMLHRTSNGKLEGVILHQQNIHIKDKLIPDTFNPGHLSQFRF